MDSAKTFTEQEYWKICLSDLRPTTQRAHIEVLKLIQVTDSICRFELATKLGRTPDGLHVTLTRLLNRGLVVRKKAYLSSDRRPMYFYSLKPNLVSGQAICRNHQGDVFRVRRANQCRAASEPPSLTE